MTVQALGHEEDQFVALDWPYLSCASTWDSELAGGKNLSLPFSITRVFQIS